ncbi:hypothetical protein [uncultured Paraglaciecola sp.]|uniref:hypothetical protein n=1 Tax=uncultured Paraglaciecola sp. TaxID=1765024 RepID=UPI00262C8E61|nr:hypothetical protein [uncultured Paraglaciecola sp.]
MDIESLKIVGGILGVVAFFWKVSDTLVSYVNLNVEVKTEPNEFLTVKVSIENKSPTRKVLTNAILLISPEEENPILTFNNLFKNESNFSKISSTRGIAVNKFENSIVGENGRIIIPLPFFYNEHESIGDEKISYRTYINLKDVEILKSYSVRFYVWGAGRLHRSSQDSFFKTE